MENKDIILYHGSKGGLRGEIKPESRDYCDFGKGFYLGESPQQVKGLVAGNRHPVIYTVKLKLLEIPLDRILKLDGIDWIYAVLANRRKCEAFNQLKVAQHWREKMNQYDVIIGPIADDKMNEAIQRFADYGMTDLGLLECMKYVNYGKQYVLKTPFACGKAEILSEKELFGAELTHVKQVSANKRDISENFVRETAKKFYGKGLSLEGIIEKEKELELAAERELDDTDYCR